MPCIFRDCVTSPDNLSIKRFVKTQWAEPFLLFDDMQARIVIKTRFRRRKITRGPKRLISYVHV